MRQHGAVAMDTDDFVDLLLRSVPEVTPLHREHLEDNFGRLLLHPLVADVRRLTLQAFETGDDGVMRRCFDVMEQNGTVCRASGLAEGPEGDEGGSGASTHSVESQHPWPEACGRG